MKKTIITLAALTFAGATGAAFAQDTGFTDLDTDQSGDLSYAEITVSMPDLTMDQFTSADTDANGSLSEEEFTTLQSSTGSGAGATDDSSSE